MNITYTYKRLINNTTWINLRQGDKREDVNSREQEETYTDSYEVPTKSSPLPLDQAVDLPEPIATGRSNMSPTPVSKDFTPEGIYLNADTVSSANVIDFIRKLKAANCNTIMFDVKDCNGYVRYATGSSCAKTNGLILPSIPLKKLIYLLKKEGIHSVVRICVFNDQLLAAKRPDLQILSFSTNKHVELKQWVDPSSKEVADYVLSLAVEVARAGADEITFDYIRYPSISGLKTNGVDRTVVIADFLKKAHETLTPYKVRVGACVFAVTVWKSAKPTIEIIGQDLKKIDPYVDDIYIMAYPSLFYPFPGFPNPADNPYEMVKLTCDEINILFKGFHSKPVLMLQAFNYKNIVFTYGVEYVNAEERACRDAGIKSRIYWNQGNYYGSLFEAWQSNGLNTNSSATMVRLTPDNPATPK